MDKLARATGLDSAEIRRRNLIQPEQMPYKVGLRFRDGSPVTYDSGDYPRCQSAALKKIDHAGFRARQAAARREGRYIGLGIANYVEGTGLGPTKPRAPASCRMAGLRSPRVRLPKARDIRRCWPRSRPMHWASASKEIQVTVGDTDAIRYGMDTFAMPHHRDVLTNML